MTSYVRSLCPRRSVDGHRLRSRSQRPPSSVYGRSQLAAGRPQPPLGLHAKGPPPPGPALTQLPHLLHRPESKVTHLVLLYHMGLFPVLKATVDTVLGPETLQRLNHLTRRTILAPEYKIETSTIVHAILEAVPSLDQMLYSLPDPAATAA